MLFIGLYLIIVFIILLFMDTRVKFVWDRKYIEVYIYNLKILKLDFEETKKYALESFKKYKFKKADLKYFEILNLIDFRKINIRICGYQGDYFSWSIAYGILQGILTIPRQYFNKKGIKYHYQVDFYGEPFIAIESIFYFKLGKILINTYKLRRNVHGKRTSNT